MKAQDVPLLAGEVVAKEFHGQCAAMNPRIVTPMKNRTKTNVAVAFIVYLPSSGFSS